MHTPHTHTLLVFAVAIATLAPSNAHAQFAPLPGHSTREVTVDGAPLESAYDRVIDARTLLRRDGCYEIEAGAPVQKTQRRRDLSDYSLDLSVLGRPAVLQLERDRDRDHVIVTMIGCFEDERMVMSGREADFGRFGLNLIADASVRWGKPITLATSTQLWRFDWKPGEPLEPTRWMSAAELERKLIELHGHSPWPEDTDMSEPPRLRTTKTWWAADGSLWLANRMLRGNDFVSWVARVREDGQWELLLDPPTAKIFDPRHDSPQITLEPWPARGTVNVTTNGIALPMTGEASALRRDMLFALSNPKFMTRTDQTTRYVHSYLGADGSRYAAMRKTTADPWRIYLLELDRGTLDVDADGLSAAREDELGTSDFSFDSDRDSSPDAAEVFLGTVPTVPDPRPPAPAALGYTRAIMEWEPLRNYRIEDDGIRGSAPPAPVWPTQDGESLCIPSSTTEDPWSCIAPDGERVFIEGDDRLPPTRAVSYHDMDRVEDAGFVVDVDMFGSNLVRRAMVRAGTDNEPIFNVQHMARAPRIGLWPTEVTLKGLHALPDGDGYVLHFDSFDDTPPGFALLDSRFGLVGEPSFGVPFGTTGSWRGDLFIAGRATRRRATSQPEGGKCVCTTGGCSCSFERTREQYVAAVEVEDNAQYRVVPMSTRGLQPRDVLISDADGNLWRRAPSGALLMWLSERTVRQDLNARLRVPLRFSDLSISQDTICLVERDGRLFTIALGRGGEYGGISRVPDVSDATACAISTTGDLVWGTSDGRITTSSAELAQLREPGPIRDLWYRPGADDLIALGGDHQLHCVSADGVIESQIPDVVGAAPGHGLAYMVRRSGELVGANLDDICTPDAPIEQLLEEPFHHGLWRQLYLGILMTIAGRHDVDAARANVAVQGPEHVLVSLYETGPDTTAYIGTTPILPFRYAPSYPHRGERIGMTEELSRHARTQDFFSVAHDLNVLAMARVPGEGPAPTDYRSAEEIASLTPGSNDEPDPDLLPGGEPSTPDGGGCAHTPAPASPEPSALLIIALLAAAAPVGRRR